LAHDTAAQSALPAYADMSSWSCATAATTSTCRVASWSVSVSNTKCRVATNTPRPDRGRSSRAPNGRYALMAGEALALRGRARQGWVARL